MIRVRHHHVLDALRTGRVHAEPFARRLPDHGVLLPRARPLEIDAAREIGEQRIIRRGALDVARLIADNVGGITGSFRIGQLADAFGMPCTPHNWGNGYDLAVHMHVELALPNCYWFEMPYSPVQVDRPYLKHKFRLDKDGYVAAPTGPGLGMELDRDALDKIMLRIER